MHDPMTVAFEIRWPIPKRRVLPNGAIWKDYKILISVWHCDPETDGTDDSCGWPWPNLSDRENKIIDEMVEWDLQFPYFTSDVTVQTSVMFNPKYEYRQQTAGDCLGMIAGAWDYIAWKRDKRRKLTVGEWWKVVSLAANPEDNLRAILSDQQTRPKDRATRFLWCVMRQYLGYHRPWYKHPRWHIRHWKIQCHPIQHLQRWLFSRCAGCGKRFTWGYSPGAKGWGNDGPRWFWSEPNVYHHECLK